MLCLLQISVIKLLEFAQIKARYFYLIASQMAQLTLNEYKIEINSYLDCSAVDEKVVKDFKTKKIKLLVKIQVSSVSKKHFQNQK